MVMLKIVSAPISILPEFRIDKNFIRCVGKLRQSNTYIFIK